MYVDDQDARGWIESAIRKRGQDARYGSRFSRTGRANDGAMTGNELVDFHESGDRICTRETPDLDKARIGGAPIDGPQVILGHEVRRVSNRRKLGNAAIKDGRAEGRERVSE